MHLLRRHPVPRASCHLTAIGGTGRCRQAGMQGRALTRTSSSSNSLWDPGSHSLEGSPIPANRRQEQRPVRVSGGSRDPGSRGAEGSPIAAGRRQEQRPAKSSGSVYQLCDRILGFVYGTLLCLCPVEMRDCDAFSFPTVVVMQAAGLRGPCIPFTPFTVCIDGAHCI